MTGKRFKLGDYSNNLQEIWFDKDYIIVRQDDAERLCELLNNFNNENKQLTYQLEICRNNKLFSRRELEKENQKLHDENQEIKQLINRMITQIEAEKINTNHPRFSATIIFTFDEFQKIKEIWKSDLR